MLDKARFEFSPLAKTFSSRLDKTAQGYQEEGIIKLLKDIRDGLAGDKLEEIQEKYDYQNNEVKELKSEFNKKNNYIKKLENNIKKLENNIINLNTEENEEIQELQEELENTYKLINKKRRK